MTQSILYEIKGKCRVCKSSIIIIYDKSDGRELETFKKMLPEFCPKCDSGLFLEDWEFSYRVVV